jgi:hypothetical protein
MPDSTTTNLEMTKPEVGASRDTWGTKWNANADILDAIFADDGTGTGVGLKAGASQIWNAILGTLKAAASRFQLVDATDTTKIVKFDASGVTTATTRTLVLPDEDDTLATRSYVRGYLPTGTVLEGYWGDTAPAGFVMLDGRTIGDASSGATNRANADCEDLFTLLWNKTANAQCAVSGGRGASAALDWAAHKTLTLPNHSGRVMAGRDNLSGSSAAVLSPSGISSTTRAATGGSATETAGVSVSGTVTVGGTASGTLSVSGTTDAPNTGIQDAPQAGSDLTGYARSFHTHVFSGIATGTLTVTANGGNSMSGSTSAVTNAQPTIMVDVIIAL